MANFIEVLKEQESFGFTGKINMLSRESGQFLGVVYLQEGLIVGASAREVVGKKAILKMIFDDLESNQDFKFVVEPEIIPEERITLKVSVGEIKDEAQTYFQDYLTAKKYRPANHLKLLINPDIIISKEELTAREFDVLAVISEWCKVADIYQHSHLLEFEITHALVSLRKKKAIKVFQN